MDAELKNGFCGVLFIVITVLTGTVLGAENHPSGGPFTGYTGKNILPKQAAAPAAAMRDASQTAFAPSNASDPPRSSLRDLPADLQGVVSGKIGRTDTGYHAVKINDDLYETTNPAHDLSTRVGAAGMTVALENNAAWGIRLTNAGAHQSVTASDNRIEISYGNIIEWYVNGPVGLEQGWTVNRKPSGGKDTADRPLLTLCLAQTGRMRAHRISDTALEIREADGKTAFQYAGLFAKDAAGKALPARFDLAEEQILISVDDRGAKYPVTVDPFVQTAKLTASDRVAEDHLGCSVSASADGATVVAGVYGEDYAGAVHVFEKSDGAWSQTAKLTASDGGAYLDCLGSSVSVSADGTTIVAGAVGENTMGDSAGAVYVFEKSEGTWTQTAKLIALDGMADDVLGVSVSVSADGATVVAGAKGENTIADSAGAVYVFEKSEGTWTQASFKLIALDGAADDALGVSVSVSADGATVVAGAGGEDTKGSSAGAVYVFERSDGAWIQTAKLTASDGEAGDCLGRSVSVNADGTTVVAGADMEDTMASNAGAAYVFEKSEGTWSQTGKLTASDGTSTDLLGGSVSVSADGTTVVVGAKYGGSGLAGAVYLFKKADETWTQAARLTALDAANNDNLGISVSMSAAGTTVVAGAHQADPGGTSNAGAVYVFYATPTVTTQAVSNVDITTATGNGTITAMGYDNPTQHGVCWNTDGEPTLADNYTEEGATDATGTFTSDITGLAAGTQYYVRAYATNSAGTGYGDPVSFNTNKMTQTITFGELAVRTYGDANFNLTATASSGLDVTYTSSDTTVAAISGSTVTIVGAGATTITASQAGNGTYYAASDVQQTLTVSKADQTITFNALASKTYGDAGFDLTATASSNLSVTYISSDAAVATISGSTVAVVGAGSTTITVSQAGNDDYNAASDVQRTLTVSKASLTITADNASRTYGNTLTFDGTEFSATGLANGDTIGSVSLSSTGAAATASAGTYGITASSATGGTFDAADYDISYVPGTLTVNKAALTITADNASKTYGNTLTFDGTEFSATGLANGDTIGSVSLSSAGAATAAGAGTYEITVSNPTDGTFDADNYNISYVSGTLTVNKADQTITFNALPSKTYGDAGFELTATASSNLDVTYSSSDTTVATISGSTVTIVGTGSTTITASQAGNDDFNAASDVQQTLTVEAILPTVTTTAASGITITTAASGGDVTDSGGAEITARGVCWSVSENPTLADDSTGNGTGTGSFTSSLTGLTPGVTYHVRAYAANSAGTGYGEDKTFTTVAATLLESAGDGNWSDPAIWQYGLIPDGSQDAVINHNITLDMDAEVKDLDVAPGKSFAVTGSHSLTVNGTAYISGTLDVGDGTATVAGDTAIIGRLILGTGTYTASGEFDASGGHVAFDGAGALVLSGDVACGGLGSFTRADGCTVQYNATGDQHVDQAAYHHLVLAGSGTKTLCGNLVDDTDIGGNITVSAGVTLNTDNHDMDVAGSWTNSGSFTAGTGTVTLTGTGQSLSGVTTFYNLAKTVTAADTLTFASGTENRTTVANILTLKGAEEQRLALRSDAPGSAWELDAPGTSALAFLDVAYGNCVTHGGMDAAGTGSVDGGNNTNWLLMEDAVITSPSNVEAYHVSDAFTLTCVDAQGNTTPVITDTDFDLALADAQNGTFYSDAAGTEEIAAITVLAGQSTALFYLEGTRSGDLAVEVTNGTYDFVETRTDPVTVEADTTAPEAFTGLTVRAVAPESATMELSWTVRESRLMKYRVWYDTATITEETLESATEVFCGQAPKAAGEAETFTIPGLMAGTTYYFVVTSMDHSGNESLLSNVAFDATLPGRPVIDDFSLTVGSGRSADNAFEMELAITGENFSATGANNLVRFGNADNVFDVTAKDTSTPTAIYADVPPGAPVGAYQVRVINENGISAWSDQTYTVQNADPAMPEVTDIVPIVGRNDEDIPITIMGNHFEADLTGITLGDADGTVQHTLTGVVWMSDTEIDAVIPSGVAEGEYCLQVHHTSGDYNWVSSVKYEAYTVVAGDALAGATTITRALEPGADGKVPEDVRLISDDDIYRDAVSFNDVVISVYLEKGTLITDGQGNPYDGAVDAPREISITPAMAEELDVGAGHAVAFTMGSPSQSLLLADGQTLFVEMDIRLPEDTDVPRIYYLESDGTLSLAGVDGQWNDVTIARGGTLLCDVQSGVPEEGYVTYTVGLILDHMSTFVAAPAGDDLLPEHARDSSGGCFIRTLGPKPDGKNAVSFGLLMLLAVFLPALASWRKTPEAGLPKP